MIYFTSKNVKCVNYDMLMTIRRAIETTLDYEKVIRDTEVSVILCDKDYIHELNSEYRNIDGPTDVLSFPLNNDIESDSNDTINLPLGDIVICIEKAQEQAKEYGHSVLREIAFLAIHSTLHLLGYDHEISESDDEDMCRRQKEIVTSLNID